MRTFVEFAREYAPFLTFAMFLIAVRSVWIAHESNKRTREAHAILVGKDAREKKKAERDERVTAAAMEWLDAQLALGWEGVPPGAGLNSRTPVLEEYTFDELQKFLAVVQADGRVVSASLEGRCISATLSRAPSEVRSLLARRRRA